MAKPTLTNHPPKDNLHPRNSHRERYDFPALIRSCPELEPFVQVNAHGDTSVDFADPRAVRVLNKALLFHFYGVRWWEIPPQYLCPPVPGRADYIHYLADLLAASNHNILPDGNRIRCLDTGTGANCIYPIIGNTTYGWHFLGTDADIEAVDAAEQIIMHNPQLKSSVELQHQPDNTHIFRNIIEPDDRFDLTLCNPPFHASAAEARESSNRKVGNLKGKQVTNAVLNFGGRDSELWYKGGEAAFISRMIRESREFASQCFWFTTLVSKQVTLPGIYEELQQAKTAQVKTISMSQGQKTTRFVAWSFLDKEAQKEWRASRWKG
jgi:23S rRNA (adenine1618-N6)-methyltransferase